MSQLSKKELAALDLLIAEFETSGVPNAMGFPASLVQHLIPAVVNIVPAIVNDLIGASSASSRQISGVGSNPSLQQLIDYRNANS